MRLRLKAKAYGNIDKGQDPEEEIAIADIQADTIKELRKKVQEWQELEGLGGGNWGDCSLFLNNKLVGYMSYNGRVWKDKLRSLGNNEVADSQL